MSDQAEPARVETDVPRDSPRTILFQFVLFPLGVVAIGVLVFLLFGMLASEDHSVREHLGDIRSGSSHRRWQAAFQLSKAIAKGDAKSYPNLQSEVADLYVRAQDDDPRIRRYLAMVLGSLGDRRSVPVLVDGLADRDPETRVYAVLALAEIGEPRAAGPVAALVADDDPALRKSVVYTLGVLGQKDSAAAVASVLNDPVTDVRWNAAIALARLDDSRALPVLHEMLDRSRTSGVEKIREDQIEAAMMGAMPAYTKLAGSESRTLLETIAARDPNLRVRSAALAAIESLR
ncbi:MAG TPA: HEAT repeat domain-containing protein [Thermoanaerobaculia bacterium]|nr:HEAT repeat domain-containing protein [Thermoanaerobaculia bacterium]